MSSDAPPPPDYQAIEKQRADAQKGLVDQQTLANRPNVNTQAGSETWHQNPDGSWTLNQSLNPTLNAAANSSDQVAAGRASTAAGLNGDIADAYAAPFSFDQFGQLGTGDDARNQAITGAYNQATSRLDPMWQQSDEQLRSQLYGQGLREGDPAFDQAMENQSRRKNDAYTSAMNMAIGQGTSAGSATFNQNLQARQQAIIEALKQRNLPLEEQNALMGYGSNPGGM